MVDDLGLQIITYNVSHRRLEHVPTDDGGGSVEDTTIDPVVWHMAVQAQSACPQQPHAGATGAMAQELWHEQAVWPQHPQPVLTVGTAMVQELWHEQAVWPQHPQPVLTVGTATVQEVAAAIERARRGRADGRQPESAGFGRDVAYPLP